MEVVQYFEGKVPNIYQYCIDDVKRNLPFYVSYNFIDKMPEKYKCAPDGYPLPVRRYTVAQRLELLIENPQRMWVDTDVLVHRWPSFQYLPGKPYIFNKTCSVSIIYCNGCPEIIKDVLGEFNKNKGWLCACKIIEGMKDKFYEFPNGCFQHLQLGKIMGTKGNWIRQSNSECTVIQKDGKIFFDKITGRTI